MALFHRELSSESPGFEHMQRGVKQSKTSYLRGHFSREPPKNWSKLQSIFYSIASFDQQWKSFIVIFDIKIHSEDFPILTYIKKDSVTRWPDYLFNIWLF